MRRETAEAAPASSDAPLYVAHTAAQQINSSLTVVLGNVALLLTQLDPGSDAHARARRALTEATRVREIVDDITRVVTSDLRWDTGAPFSVFGGSGRGTARRRS